MEIYSDPFAMERQISSLDVNYDLWNERRTSIQEFSQMSQSCIFTVDVFKEKYDFASDNFANIFGGYSI